MMATEKRLDLIDRKNLIKAVEKKQFAIGDNTHPYEAIRIQGKYFREVVEGALTGDAVEVVHGRWIGKEEKLWNMEYHVVTCWECSECGVFGHYTQNYCPNCGAKMDGGEVNE